MSPKKLLESLEIKNFRGFKHLQVEKLGHVNLIVGQNNVGKSSLLEAIEIFTQRGRPSSFFNIAKRRHELFVDIKSPEQLERIDFSNFLYNWLTDFSTLEPKRLTTPSIIGEINSSSSLQLSHSFAFKTNDGTLIMGPAHLQQDRHDSDFHDILTVNTEGNKTEYLYSTYTHKWEANGDLLPPFNCHTVPTANSPLEELAELWDKIALTSHDDKVIAAINIIEPKIKKIAFVKVNSYTTSRAPIARYEGTNKTTPLTSMGDGTLRILQVALNATLAEAGVLLIDEFENGLHHSTQKKIWEFVFALAKELNIQVFATTHSLDCLKAFSAVSQESTDLEGVAFRLGRSAMKSNKGDIIATVMDEDGLSRLLAMELEIR